MPNGLPTGEFFIGNYVEPVDVPCLTKDSTVKTPSGFVNICALKKYDIVVTNDGRHVPITKIQKLNLQQIVVIHHILFLRTSLERIIQGKNLK